MVEENNQSLVKCLEAAISEPDLVADIIEACRLSNTSAGDLAGWSLEDIVSLTGHTGNLRSHCP